jgi:hypothetical protein
MHQPNKLKLEYHINKCSLKPTGTEEKATLKGLRRMGEPG